MAIVGAPSLDLVNTFVAPGRFLPEVLAPQVPRQAPLEQPPSIRTERPGGAMQGITSPRKLVSQIVDRVNDGLRQLKVAIGISVESRRGRDRIVVQETTSQTRLGEISTRQLLTAQTRIIDATNIPSSGLPSGLFVNRAL